LETGCGIEGSGGGEGIVMGVSMNRSSVIGVRFQISRKCEAR
jgi:hypothetical protein